ncbi:hypothetical protein BSL78_26039 [Apostichopus japonicus]|uniref:Uncharacterized protein n=1 Tax=Stichopus japonicus TaxID=307972 RepID=A0A2G8JN49_STIJA|nr:hypothetical protein BSL78_26039 [Apostichopus japonicus]
MHKCKLRREQDHEESEEQKRRHSFLQDARMLLPPPIGVPAGDVIHRLLNSLLCDDVSVCIRGDPIIVELARKICFKHGHDKEQFKTLRTKLREIACLILEYQQISGQHSATLADQELLRSTQLRKHIAAMSQVMALQDNELDVLANFLGHDVRAHRKYYRLPDATTQVAKVSKLLIALEGGSGDPGQVLQERVRNN